MSRWSTTTLYYKGTKPEQEHFIGLVKKAMRESIQIDDYDNKKYRAYEDYHIENMVLRNYNKDTIEISIGSPNLNAAYAYADIFEILASEAPDLSWRGEIIDGNCESYTHECILLNKKLYIEDYFANDEDHYNDYINYLENHISIKEFQKMFHINSRKIAKDIRLEVFYEISYSYYDIFYGWFIEITKNSSDLDEDGLSEVLSKMYTKYGDPYDMGARDKYYTYKVYNPISKVYFKRLNGNEYREKWREYNKKIGGRDYNF